MRVIADPRFARWYQAQGPAMRASVASLLGFLAAASPEGTGPAESLPHRGQPPFPQALGAAAVRAPGRPRVALRVLVVLHDDATAVALVAGDKTGNWTEWYEVAVPTADAYY
ncbi:MAG: hypothetical protein ACRD1K_09025, partial [Acidimicrobiales bacterium]